MKAKSWVVAVVLLLAIGRPACAAAGGFQTLAAGIGVQLEMRHTRIPAVDAARFFVPAPGGAWQPLLQVAAPWSERYAGVVVKASRGRLSLLIATLAPRQATLVELRLSVRRLLDGLRRGGTIVSRGVTTVAED